MVDESWRLECREKQGILWGSFMSKDIEDSRLSQSRRRFLVRMGYVIVGTAAFGSAALWMKRVRGKSAYQLGKDAIAKYQELSCPKIEELLGIGNYHRCCTAMLREYGGFSQKLPEIKGRRNRTTFYASAPFMLSLYRALLGEFAFEQDTALKILNQVTCYKVHKDWESRTVTRFMMSRVAQMEFFRKLAMKGFKWEDEEEYGWAAEFPESEAYIAVDITRCGLVKWFTEQGAPEIAPIACEGDFVWAEFMTGLELRRTQTLASGDNICDFRYVKK
jgi:hypothetical protein